MAPTAAQILELRRLCGLASDDATYTDALLTTFISRYPRLDERGVAPYTWDTSTEPPTQDANENWIATYDLHSAAGDIWEEKAAAVAARFDFQADGASYTRSQEYQHAMQQARYHRARRTPTTMTLTPWPNLDNDLSWIGNLPESD